MWRAGGVFAVLVGGCAAIQTTETIDNAPLPPAVHESTLPGSLTYDVTTSVVGAQLSIAVEQSESCATITTQRVHRRRHVAKTAESSTLGMFWGVAIGGLGGGVYGYLNAEALASPPYSVEQYRSYSAVTAIVGLAALAVAAIDTARAADDDFDDGVIEGERDRALAECRRGPARGKDVTIVFASGERLPARLDRGGASTFRLTPISEADLAGPLAATIGDARVAVSLAVEDVTTLHTALAADPRSRIAIDRLAARRTECTRQASIARAADDHDAWLAAKTGCADLWTGELETERVAAEARGVLRRCDTALSSIETTIANAATVDDLALAEGTVLEVRNACTSAAHVARMQQLEARAAAMAKQLARAQQEEEKRIAREEAAARRAAQQAAQREAAAARLWSNSRLRCNDGSLSPSCTCGRSSYQGCCSWHGGVASCSADR